MTHKPTTPHELSLIPMRYGRYIHQPLTALGQQRRSVFVLDADLGSEGLFTCEVVELDHGYLVVWQGSFYAFSSLPANIAKAVNLGA